MRTTHTYTTLEVSREVMDHLKMRIREAGEEYLHRYVEEEDGRELIHFGGEVALTAEEETPEVKRLKAELAQLRVEMGMVRSAFAEASQAAGPRAVYVESLQKENEQLRQGTVRLREWIKFEDAYVNLCQSGGKGASGEDLLELVKNFGK